MWLFIWLYECVQAIEPVIGVGVFVFQIFILKEINRQKRKRGELLEQMFTNFVEGLSSCLKGFKSLSIFAEKYGSKIAEHFDNLKDIKEDKKEGGSKNEKQRDEKHKRSTTDG